MNAEETNVDERKPPAVECVAEAQDERNANVDELWENFTRPDQSQEVEAAINQDAAELDLDQLGFSIPDLLRESVAGGPLDPSAIGRSQILHAHQNCLFIQAKAYCVAAIAGLVHLARHIRPIMASFPNETKLEMLSDVGAIAGRIQDFTHRVTLFSTEVEAVVDTVGYQPMDVNESPSCRAQSSANASPSVAVASPAAASPRRRPNTSLPNSRKASVSLRAKKEMALKRLVETLVSYFQGNSDGKPSKEALKVFNNIADAVDCKAPSPSKSPKTEGGVSYAVVKWMWNDGPHGPELANKVVKAFISGCGTDRGNMDLLNSSTSLVSLQRIFLDQAMDEAANANAAAAQEAEA